MGILEAVAGLFTGGWRTLKHGAEVVWQAIKSVYLFAAGIFSLVGEAWTYMVNGIGWLADNIVGFAARVLHLLEYVTLHLIPRAVAWAIGKAVRWAKGAIHEAKHLLEVALNEAKRWIVGRINEVVRDVRAAFRAVWHPITTLFNWFERTAKHAVDLVLHPDRLVQWILGALVLPLVKWLVSFSAPIIVWLVKGAVRLLPQLAHTIEDALAKLV